MKFWEDVWCGERTLNQDFGYLFALAAEPRSLVAENFFSVR